MIRCAHCDEEFESIDGVVFCSRCIDEFSEEYRVEFEDEVSCYDPAEPGSDELPEV